MKKRQKTLRGPGLALVLLILAGALSATLYIRFFAKEEGPAALPPVQTRTGTPEPGASAPPAEATPLPSAEPDPEAGSLLISEYMVKNRAVLQSADGSFYDWIELLNASDHRLSLEGWTVAEGKKTWALPAVGLDSGERLLIFASGLDRRDGELHAGFSLSEGEKLRVYTSRGALSDETVCLAPGADLACVRNDDGSFSASRYPSPGYPNDRAGYVRWQETLTSAGPLQIAEAAVKNYDFDFGAAGSYPDWIELRNVSDRALELSDYTLSDSSKDYRKYRLPTGQLAAGETKLILCTEDEGLAGEYDCLPLSLDSESERLYLADSEGLVDFLPLRDIPYGGSCGRLDGENGSFYFTEPTPGKPNAEGRRYLCEKPRLLTAEGVFEGVDSVELALMGEGTVYYTLDGSLPTADSSRYEGPLVIDKTCAVRAVCDDGIGLPSRPASFSFFLNEGHSLPVLSVLGDDPAALAELYKRGLKGEELSGSISFYEEGGGFTINCGIRMVGRATLHNPKKNVGFRFRGAYGQSRLSYDLFGGGMTEFSALTIRAGQELDKNGIRNELCQDLAAQFSDNYVNQRSRYCAVYFNGEYYGVFALKEKINEQYCADYAGVSKDSVTMYDGPAISGEDFWDEVSYPILYEDITDPAVYERVCRYLDMDSYIDWLIIEGYCGNRDIIYGNVSYFRSPDYHDNRWITIFYDLDATFRDGRYNFRNLHNLNYSINQNSQMLRCLLQNESFREAYLTRAAEALNGPLSNDNVVATIQRLYAQIDGEMERSCLRWDYSYADYLASREKLLNLIPSVDYYKNSIDVICEMAGLSEEERVYYFGS